MRLRAYGIALTAALAVVAGAGCVVHDSAGRVLGPGGNRAVITLVDKQELSGELLSIADGKIYFAESERIVVVAAGDVHRLRITDFGATFVPRSLEKARPYSRYPQGLSADQWEAVLRHAGQTQPERIEAAAAKR